MRIELTTVQKLVLKYIKERKSYRHGRDLYCVAQNDFPFCRNDWNLESMPTRDEWNSAKDSLIAAGFLNEGCKIKFKGQITFKGHKYYVEECE